MLLAMLEKHLGPFRRPQPAHTQPETPRRYTFGELEPEDLGMQPNLAMTDAQYNELVHSIIRRDSPRGRR